MTFKYKQVARFENNSVKAPFIPITDHGDINYETFALIDSGADISAIPQRFAEILGIKLPKTSTISYGVDGGVKSYLSKINISVEKGKEKEILTLPIKIFQENCNVPPLLGRLGFFDKFIITFNQNIRENKIKKQPKHVNSHNCLVLEVFHLIFENNNR